MRTQSKSDPFRPRGNVVEERPDHFILSFVEVAVDEQDTTWNSLVRESLQLRSVVPIFHCPDDRELRRAVHGCVDSVVNRDTSKTGFDFRRERIDTTQMTAVESNRRFLILLRVRRSLLLMLIQRSLDILRQSRSQSITDFRPGRHCSRRVGDDELLQSRGLVVDGVLYRFHAATALAEKVEVLDLQVRFEVFQFCDVQSEGEEGSVAFVVGEMGVVAAAELVVHDYWDAEVLIDEADGEDVV